MSHAWTDSLARWAGPARHGPVSRKKIVEESKEMREEIDLFYREVRWTVVSSG